MESKYYAYYKPPYNPELMNNIKEQLSEEYPQDVVKPLLQKIFNNINCNDTDEYLCADKQNYYLILIKFTLVNEVFSKDETIDKSQYTLISKSIDWNAKKLKINNINQFYSCDTNNYYSKSKHILFNGSGINQQTNNETQYIFAEYLTIPITPIIISNYKDIDAELITLVNSNTTSAYYDNYHSITTSHKEIVFKNVLNRYKQSGTHPLIINIMTLLNTIFLHDKNLKCYNDIVTPLKIIPYIDVNDVSNVSNVSNMSNVSNVSNVSQDIQQTNTPITNDNKDYIKTLWNDIYKQPENVYDVFNNHKLIVDNLIYTNNTPDARHITNACLVYTYLYITQKQFSSINYKDALPFRLSFDTKFKYNGALVNINHNRELDYINRHNLEISKLIQKIEHFSRTKPLTDNCIVRAQETINYHEIEITGMKTKLLKINKYYKDHLLFHTNIGFKLTFEAELNGYKSLLYLRYMCNNYSRLNNNLLISYDNSTDKRNDIVNFYVSNTLLNELITMKIKPDLFTLSRFFNITTEDKYQDDKYKIINHEINKSFEITNKESETYKKFSKFLDTTINLKLFDYQKNNLLWMLKLEDTIDAKKLCIESYINKFNINHNTSSDIKTFIYSLKSYIPEIICKEYFITVPNDKKYIIDIKNEGIVHCGLITALNANNARSLNKNSYNNDFNIINSIITPKEHKEKCFKNIEFCGGAICDEVGLGKTLSIISHLVFKLKHDMLKCSNYKKEMNNLVNVLNIDANYYNTINNTNTFIDPLDKGFEFNNLIIVPSRLTSQWENEIEKYVKNKFNLRAKVLIGINSIKALEKELNEFYHKQSKLKKDTKMSTEPSTENSNSNSNNLSDDKIVKKNIKIKLKTKVDTIIQNVSIINPIQIEINETITPIESITKKLEIVSLTESVKESVSELPLKQSKEQKMIAKLMLKAKKVNDKLSDKLISKNSSDKPSVKISDKPIDKPIDNTINNILNNAISNSHSQINEVETIESIEQPVEPSEPVSVPVNTYEYVNTYLNYNQTSANNKAIENDYLSNNLYDIYIVSSNLLFNENYLTYIEHTSDNHLNQHYVGETKQEQQNTIINLIKKNHKNNSDFSNDKDSSNKNTTKNSTKDSSTKESTKDSTPKLTYNYCRLSDKFNIFKIKWNRVILDEAHEKLCPTIKMFSTSLSKYISRTKSVTFESQFLYENLCSINSNYKWAMTGTPSEQGIDSIMGILEFLRVKDNSENTMTRIDKIRYLHDTIGISPTNLDTLLNTIFKKTFKKDVKTLLNIPLFTEEIIYIEQNNIERNIYNSIRCSRHFSEVVKLRTLFLMCTNILISNEFDVDGECENNTRPNGGPGVEPEFLTLEQLNTNMIAKFNQQLKQLIMNKNKLIKRNSELEIQTSQWIQLIDYMCGLNLDDCIEPRILQSIHNLFGDLENNRIRTNCEVFYNILNVFEVWRNIPTLGFALSSNVNMIRDHLYRIWDNAWSTNESILIKCSESGAKLGVIKVKDEITKNEKKISSFDSDKTRINNQIALFSSNDFLTDKSKDPCIICFDDLTDIVVTPCRHIFCLTCTKKLSNDLKCNFTCPECRSSVDYKTVNITNIDMINKKEEEVAVDSVVAESSEGGTVVELTPLEKKLGKDWKNKCVNKYGSKMSKLIEYLYSIFNDPANRVIIFSQYDKMLKMISKTLDEYGIKFIHCTGNNYVLNRNIMKFKKDDSYRVILLSSENANSGSNLTEASYIIMADVLQHDTETNKSIENQILGRILRIGQKKETKMVRFITKGTIEEEHYNNTKYDINILQA